MRLTGSLRVRLLYVRARVHLLDVRARVQAWVHLPYAPASQALEAHRPDAGIPVEPTITHRFMSGLRKDL